MSSSLSELVAISRVTDWIPYGKALSVVALGALLVTFVALVAVAFHDHRKRRRTREIDPKFLDRPARRTDFLWEERYGGKDYE
jgi:hypothetical protein